jgi:hypothetical protein
MSEKTRIGRSSRPMRHWSADDTDGDFSSLSVRTDASGMVTVTGNGVNIQVSGDGNVCVRVDNDGVTITSGSGEPEVEYTPEDEAAISEAEIVFNPQTGKVNASPGTATGPVPISSITASGVIGDWRPKGAGLP